MPGRVLIVEDDVSVARSLRRLLAHEEYYVDITASAEEASARLAADPAYDLVLLDVSLPGMNGYACCKQLRSRGWTGPIIMLTARYDPRDRVIGLQTGADDYVTKPFDPEELLARVRAQIRRTRDYNAPGGLVSQIRIDPYLVIDLDLRDAIVRGQRANLTAREFELLELMARQPGAALKKKWLFQQVWGCAPETSMKLLAVTIRRLRLKIEDDPDRPAHLLTIRGFGYKLSSSAMPSEM